MTDIVQRALNLQVGAEDVASEVFSAVADELDALQAKAESVFGAIAMQGEDAMSALADAANGFAPLWDDQLQAVAEFAGGAFAALEESAAAAGSGVAEAAAPIASAWEGAAAKMTGALDEAAGSVTGSADKIKGALDGIDGSLSAISGSADGAKSGLTSALDAAAGSVSGSADKIKGALDGISGASNGITTSVDKLPGSFSTSLDTTSTTVSTASGKIVASLDEIVSAADKAGMSLRLQGPTSTSTGKGGVGGPGGAGGAAFLGSPAGAKASEESVLDRWMPKVSAVKERAALIGAEFKKLEEKISGVGNKMLMGGIVASMIPFGAESAANYIEGLTTTSKQTGLSMSNSYVLQNALVSLGVKNPAQAIAMIARMENRLHQGTTEVAGMSGQTVTGALNEPGNPKGGINPGSLNIGVPNVQIERVLAPYGLNATQLFHMSALDQITAISQAINAHQGQGPVWSNRATALIQMLFGGRGGGGGAGSASMQLVMRDWAEGLAAAQKSPNPIKDLGLPANPLQAAITARSIGYSVETGMLTVLTRLLPVLEKFTTGLEKFTNDVLHPGLHSAKDLNPLNPSNWPEDIIALWAGSKGLKGAKGIAGLIGKLLGKAGGGGEAGAAAEGAGGAAGLTGALKFFGPEGAALSVIGSTAGWQMTQMGKFENWIGNVIGLGGKNPQTVPKGFASTVLRLAPKYGIDPLAALAVSSAEGASGGIGDQGHAYGPWQMNDLVGVLTGKFHGARNSKAAQSFAWSTQGIEFALQRMAAGGAKGLSGEAAIKAIIAGFERPKDYGDALKSGLAPGAAATKTSDFAVAMRDYPKMAQDARKLFDGALLQLVQSADTHGKQFSTATKQMLTDTETYLKQGKDPFAKAGRDLLAGLEKGLQQEKPSLLREAHGIALELENVIRAALKTHSPSEVTADIGADLMAGLGLGMRRSASDAIATAASEASRVVGALAGAGGRAAAAAGAPQTIIVELDGRTLVQYVLRETHQQTKLVAKFN